MQDNVLMVFAEHLMLQNYHRLSFKNFPLKWNLKGSRFREESFQVLPKQKQQQKESKRAGLKVGRINLTKVQIYQVFYQLFYKVFYPLFY